jgi:autotransporter-associated beta strand protein
MAESSTWTTGTAFGAATQELTASGTNTTGLAVGQTVSGPGIPANSYITQIVDSTHFVINAAATTATTATMTIGAATFNPVVQTVANLALTSGTGTVNVTQNGGSGASVTVTNGVTGAGALNETGNGLLTLSGSGSYSGGTTINGGTLNYGNLNALSSGAVTFTGSSSLQAGLSGTLSNNVAVNPTQFGSSEVTGTYAGVLQNGASPLALTKTGTSTLTLTGNNTDTGVTDLNAGILNVGSSLALGGGGNLTFLGGTLQYSAANQVDYSSVIKNSTSAISVDTNTQNVTFATGLASSNTGGLTKNGAGTLTLSVANTYTGATTVSGGTLSLTHAGTAGNATGGTLGNTAITVNSGGTLLLGAANAIGTDSNISLSGTFKVANGGNYSEGSGAHATGATFNSSTQSATGGSYSGNSNVQGMGNLTLSGNSTLSFGNTASTEVFGTFSDPSNLYTLTIGNYSSTASILNGTSGTDGTDDRLIFDEGSANGGNGLTTAQLADISFAAGPTAEINLGGGYWEVGAIPEPTTIFGALALLGFVGYRERRRIVALVRWATRTA